MLGMGEQDFVLGKRNIFLMRSAKQEREAKFGMRECGNANLRTLRKKLYTGARERKGKLEERGNAGRDAFQERAPIPGYISSAQYIILL